MSSLIRRLWWATLPYYGWIPHTKEDEECGAVPPPWYAYPLAWLHRLVGFVYRGDVFGPQYNRDQGRVNAPHWKPWQ